MTQLSDGHDGIRVLVIDDERVVRLCCERTLMQRGFALTTVSDALEATELLRDGEVFDLIIADLKMPGMDGLEFFTNTRRLSGTAAMILMTGFATDDTQQQATALGIVFLAKPFAPAQLTEAIDQALQRRARRTS